MRPDRDLPLRWTGHVPLVWRILAVNIFVIALLAFGLLYLDSYRSRLVEERQVQLGQHAQTLAAALRVARDDAPTRATAAGAATPATMAAALVVRFAQISGARIRIYDRDGEKLVDSFNLAPPTYVLRDPDTQAWQRRVARTLDRMVDSAVRAIRPGPYREPAVDRAAAWAELRIARRTPERAATYYRFAPDRTPMVSAAIVSDTTGQGILLLTNARDITRTVRAERLNLGYVLALVTLLSVLLSLFLARTIVRPLQNLAKAAVQVRLGRERDVIVPRLPSRRDEIGQLARALSDMTHALRDRIDAGEHFAADVTHELKNPLASLRSALEGAERVERPDLRARLLAIAADDVRRLDRLITDISEASRIDAELSRTHFTTVDIGQLVESILAARGQRATDEAIPIAFARPRSGIAQTRGDSSRLMRVFENLLDNALSFSPPGGVVLVSVTNVDATVIVRIEDDGPGVAADQRDAIFRRFHSIRPDSDDFGRHSGLGLAIARTIVEAHSGTLMALDRPNGAQGACFEVRLPAVEPPDAA